MLRGRRYRIFILILLLGCLLTLWRLGTGVLSQPDIILTQDFGQIWAAGHLVFDGENPYDPNSISQMRDELAGSSQSQMAVPVFYSPPWVILISIPFGSLPYAIARLLWLLVNIIIILVSSNMLWKLYGGSPNHRWIALLTAFTFAPTLSVLSKGQITPFILLGLVLFIDLVMKRKFWLAGISSALITIKPQILYLFWPALVLWVVSGKRWKVIGGLIIAILVAMGLLSILNPNLILQYFFILRNYSPVAWFTPTIGAYLRLLFGIEKFWLQFVPIALGLALFLFYWRNHRSSWDWLSATPTIVVLSLLTMPYGWTYDLVLLLAALIPAWVILEKSTRKTIFLFGSAYLVINLSTFILHRIYSDDFFVWLVPVWLVWYLLVVKKVNASVPTGNPPSITTNNKLTE